VAVPARGADTQPAPARGSTPAVSATGTKANASVASPPKTVAAAPSGPQPAQHAGTRSASATGTTATARAAAAPATLDLKSLEQRLRDTKAIGVFTKLSLKIQVDDLLADMKAFHGGRSLPPLPELRQSYESLLLKVVTVLQNGDPQLASAVSASRDSIWTLLSDPKKFSEIT
jgi:hypothetical protein